METDSYFAGHDAIEHAQAGHNVGGIAGERLVSICERYERLELEKKAIASDQADILKEASSSGLDVKVVRQILKLRKLDPNELQEQDALIAVYRQAVGLG